MKSIAFISLFALIACTPQNTEIFEQDSALTVCPDGTTIKGIDVAYHEGNINWSQVKAAGYHFAFIRVSDGASFQDPKFATNWAAAKQAGVIRGAYQFFRPNQDVVAQANLMLSMMGTLQPGDLPPVIDVEATGNLSPSVVTQKVTQWISIVEAATGRKPIIYSGKYFWEDNVGSSAFSSYPLWHAQYTSNTCPNIANQWSDWTFFQYSESGNVPGIPEDLTDLNYFNGSLQDLINFANNSANQPTEPDCEAIPSAGAIIDDLDACFTAGGPQQYLHGVSNEGYNSGLIWTGTTASANEGNFAQWDLRFAQAGIYKVEVYTDTDYARSKKAKYKIKHNGFTDTVTLDQTTTNGWRSLGQFEFSQAEGQNIHLSDNTSESNVKLGFDAVRITPVTTLPCGYVGVQLILDEEEDCVVGGGPLQYLHSVTGEGYNNGLVYTGTTASSNEYNFVQWNLNFAQSGTYKVEVYTDADIAKSKYAKYKIRHNGASHSVTVNQSTQTGWRSLGNFTFAAGESQYIHLGDNTGESSSQNIKIAFDAVRITRVTTAGLVDEGESVDEVADDTIGGTITGGCSMNQNDNSWMSFIFLGVVLIVVKRRSRG